MGGCRLQYSLANYLNGLSLESARRRKSTKLSCRDALALLAPNDELTLRLLNGNLRATVAVHNALNQALASPGTLHIEVTDL